MRKLLQRIFGPLHQDVILSQDKIPRGGLIGKFCGMPERLRGVLESLFRNVQPAQSIPAHVGGPQANGIPEFLFRLVQKITDLE